jgi:beta-lactamase superfamily II metal-dependent hydrolase
VLAAIITHTHDDHLGGMVEVLEELGESFVGEVLLNNERLLVVVPVGESASNYRKRLRSLFLRLAEFGDRVQPATEPSGGQCGRIAWRLLAPRHVDIVTAVARNDPNIASGVVDLEADGLRVVVGGDATIDTWERIATEIEHGAVLRWPHHAGSLGPAGAEERLLEIANPVAVVVSVGTARRPGLPSDVFFNAAREHSSRLVCTEATEACIVGAAAPGRCAGTVRVRFEPGLPLTTSSANHAAVVTALGAARCLLGPTVQTTA